MASHRSKKTVYHNPHVAGPPKPPTKFLWVLEAIFVALCVFIVLAFVLILILAATNHNKAKDAITNAAQLFSLNQAQSNYQNVHSTLGFELTYNNALQSAEGIVKSTTGQQETIVAPALQDAGSYATINVYKNALSSSATSSEQARTTYVAVSTTTEKDFFKAHQTLGNTEQQITEKFFVPSSDSSTSYKLTKSENVTLGSYGYKKQTYEVTHSGAVPYTTLQTDYITIQNNRPYKASLYQNPGYSTYDLPTFEAVITSLKYFPPEQTAEFTSFKPQLQQAQPKRLSLVGQALGIGEAQAAENQISDDAEISVVAKNQPAVVRIAATYCPDFKLRLHGVEQSFTGGCAAQYGSGFIISPDGLIATNGHVVKASVAEVMLDSIAVRNVPMINSYLQFLVNTNLLTKASADKASSLVQSGDTTILKQLVGSLSDPSLDNVEFAVTRDDGVYAVQLGKEAVKFNVKNLKQFGFNNQIVSAKLVDADYDPYDNKDGSGFKKSDVAILKAETPNNYPYMKLGSLNGLGQGSPLTVMGYPGVADHNELVSDSQSIPSATRGSVSAIRDAKGNGKKLIQSDVSIAPGNSGGPALDKNGNVVGIATYGLTGEQQGGNYNYMRDVADLKDLLSKNNITLPAQVSGVESLWQSGLRNFSNAYYSAAIADFKKAKGQYPPFYLADDFIARAESEKANGKEATPPQVYFMIAALMGVLLIIPAVVLFIVIRHHHKRRDAHRAYTDAQTPPAPPAPETLVPTQQPVVANNKKMVDMIQVAPSHTGQPTPPPAQPDPRQTLQVPINKPPA